MPTPPMLQLAGGRGGGGAITFVGSISLGNLATGSGVVLTYTSFVNTAGGAVTAAVGDFIVVCTCHAGTAARSLTQLAPFSNSTGLFTAAHASPVGANDSNYCSGAAHYQFVGASDTQLTIVNCAASGNAVAATMHCFRGVNPTTPLDVATTVAGAANTATVNPPAITPVTPGALILVSGMAAMASGNTLIPGFDLSSTNSHTRQQDANATNDACIATGLKTDWTSGAFDPSAFTGGGAAATDSWGALTMALRPA